MENTPQKLKEENKTFYGAIEKVESKFIELVDKSVYEREKSYAIQIFRKNPYLQKASYNSVVESMINVANIGLTLNPALKLAYLVPRYNNQLQSLEVCLEASYQGLVKLITDTGSAKNLYCHAVYEGDEFSNSLGTDVKIKHVPKYPSSKKPILYYAIAVLADGSKQVEIMEIAEINDIRDRSESYKAYLKDNTRKTIWNDDYSEMCRKTVIRRLCKYLPKTEMWDKIAQAIKLDESDYSIADWQHTMIESMLMSSSIDHEERASIEREMHSYSYSDAKKCLDYLERNQVNPIHAGNNYSQTDIVNEQKRE